MLCHVLFCPLHFLQELSGGHAKHTAAQGADLDQGIGAGYPDVVVAADLMYQSFDVGIARLIFLCVNHLDIVKLYLFSGITFDLVAVKDQNHPAFSETSVAAEQVAKAAKIIKPIRKQFPAVKMAKEP